MQSLAQSFDRSSHINFDNTSMENPVLVASVTKALDSKPFDFCQSPRFVTRPKEGTSVPNNKKKPATPGMDSFRERLFQKKYQRNLPLLSQMLDDQAQSLFTNSPGISGIADVLGN